MNEQKEGITVAAALTPQRDSVEQVHLLLLLPGQRWDTSSSLAGGEVRSSEEVRTTA